ncbi:MAG TPA: cyclic nucleotide-binding domain-containing protein, partial [Myxococcota bacterium]
GIRIIETVCEPRQVEIGMPIFVERVHGESAFLIVAGEVQLSVEREGQPRVLTVLSAPDVIGELTLLRPGPRRVTARARTQVGVIEINRREFLNLQKQRPQACIKLLMNVTDRLAQRLEESSTVLERLVDMV